MEFDYFYGSQADQFSFIRIPKTVVTGEAFNGLSVHSKMLYGMLLDKMGISMENNWMDDEGRIYIEYPIADIQDDMQVSKRKAVDYLAELEEAGLIKKKVRGQGKPSIIYIMNFIAPI